MKMDLQASLTWVLLLSAALLSEPARGAWSNSPEGSEDKDQKSLWKKFSDWIKSKFKPKEVPQLRLVSGGDRCAGRVEVYYEGKWGTVCDDNFDVNSGSVVCKQLDCGQVVSVLGQSYFGPGKGDIHLDDVVCRGTESYLWDCRHGGWNRHNCGHNEDVSVICSASSQTPQTSTSASTFSTDSTVVTSTTASLISTGKASVTPSASTAATEKTVPSAPEIPTAAYKAPESTAGSSISPPPFAGDGGTSAPEIPSTAAEETGNLTTSAPVTESTEPSAAPAPPSTPSKDMSLRLVNGGDTCSGRLEVFHNGSWATVCDDGWDMKDAAVVCRQLGCGDAVSAKTDAFFGEGTGDIILDEVTCRGDESSLEQCSHRGLGTHNCCHKEDVGVICEASEEPTTPEVTVLKSTTAGAPVTTSPTPEPTDVTTLPTESTTAENAVTDSCIPPFSPTPEAAATTTFPTESTTAENTVTDSPALPVSPTPEAAATTTFHQKPDPAPISPEDLTYLPKYVRVMLLRYLTGLCQPRRPGMQSIKLQGCVRDPTCRNYYYYAPGTRIVQFKYRALMYPRVCLRCKVLACNRYSYPFQHYQGYLARGKRSASDTIIVIIPK